MDQHSLSATELNHIFSLASQAHSAGDLDQALLGYVSLIDRVPASALLQYNLGLVYFGLDRFEESLQAFLLADTLEPQDCDTLFNLALCQGKVGHPRKAIALYLQVLALFPEHVDALYNLGGCYQRLHQDAKAMEYYQKTLTLAPAYLSALNNLAYLYHRADEIDEATALYARVLELRPEDESVRYLLAALLGLPLTEAPDVYVQDFFDAYAEDFERSLVKDLGYNNPRLLFDCFCQTTNMGLHYSHGLDLGCGTGLSGQAFKERIDVLDGVDLSPAMLKQAETKGCYQQLCQDSIDHFLHSTTEKFDFFIATDVFIYVGALESIFTMAHAHACAGALFCFSTEELHEAGYRLQPSGRFAYSSNYIHHLADSTGWKILAEQPSQLRRERDGWIRGELWVFQWQELLAEEHRGRAD